MKALLIFSAVATFCAIAIPRALCQDDVTDRRLQERLTPQGNFMQYEADRVTVALHFVVFAKESISLAAVLNDLSNDKAMPRPKNPEAIAHGTVHLEGRARITIFNKALAWPASTRDELSKEMVLTADEADYDVDTGEIHPQGHVSIDLISGR
jgi:hypothetical protein